MKRVLTTLLLATMLMGSVGFASASAAEVYVTKNGKKYHTAECQWIKDRETTKMEEKDAIAKGYTPCGRCIKKEETKEKGK